MADKKIKTNGHGASLDQKIAACIASDEADKAELTALVADAVAAIAEAEETIKTETAAALDIANPNPDDSDLAVRKAQRTVARLDTALPKLRERIRSIEAVEHAERWDAEFGGLATQRDKLAAQLNKQYAKWLDEITTLFAQIDENSAAIDALHMRAPGGENRRLLDAELVARNLPGYDAAHPRLREHLRIPDFDVSRDIAFPVMIDFNARAVMLSEALRTQMAQKLALTASPQWAEARELQIAEERAETAKREEELKQAEAERLEEYQKHQREAELRRRGLTPEEAT